MLNSFSLEASEIKNLIIYEEPKKYDNLSFLDENSTYIDNQKSEILNDYFGLKSVYKVSTIGDDVIRSGSFSTSSAEQTPMSASWYTGSEYTSESDGWFISGSALHANQTASAGDTLPYVYQISTDSFASDGTIEDPPINQNIQQFESAQSFSHQVRFLPVICETNHPIKAGRPQKWLF